MNLEPFRNDRRRWFAVKVWMTWRVGDAPLDHVEERIYLVRATSTDEAHTKGHKRAARANRTFENELGETVTISLASVDSVYDTWAARVSDGFEVFGQVFELEDGEIDSGHPTE
jgi:hypothetical protein